MSEEKIPETSVPNPTAEETEAPKKRVTRTRRKVEPVAVEASGEEPTQEETKPKRRTTRKKAEPAEEASPAAVEKPVTEAPAREANFRHQEIRENAPYLTKSSPAAQQDSPNSEESPRGEHREHRHDRGEDRDFHRNIRRDRNNRRDRNSRRERQHQKSRPLGTKYMDLLKEPEDAIRQTALDLGLYHTTSMSFDETAFEVFSAMVEQEGQGLGVCKGILEILSDGYGFVRDQLGNIDKNDVYVSQQQIRKLGLRTGDAIVGQTRSPKDNEAYSALLRVECINDMDPERARKVVPFDSLVPLYPNAKFNLHSDSRDPSVRIVDLITPIGLGQRGLIVAPPKAGKTTLLKQIANSLTSNHPNLTLFVLLIDERPEEVTDMTRSIEGEVIASTFDQHLNNHIRVSEMVLERAKRLVELGKDVVILLDSITRLARAYNIAVPSSGQTLSGGVNPLALYKPKKFFGSARNIEFGGSLTILATALVDTGSKMDDVIFEEFKGTGNMELHLDRALFNKRVFPAINLTKSSTRREELLVTPDSLKGMNILRRVFENLSAQEAIELLKKQMKTSKANEEFLSQIQKQAGLTHN